MVDKLTFSFAANARVRIGGQEIKLRESTDSLAYHSASKGDRTLQGFKAADGTFFRLKDRAGGGVDVIVYGEPKSLARYRFSVKSGELAKARFADGDFRRSDATLRQSSFTLDGAQLSAVRRQELLDRYDLSRHPAPAGATGIASNATPPKQFDSFDDSNSVIANSAGFDPSIRDRSSTEVSERLPTEVDRDASLSSRAQAVPEPNQGLGVDLVAARVLPARDRGLQSDGDIMALLAHLLDRMPPDKRESGAARIVGEIVRDARDRDESRAEQAHQNVRNERRNLDQAASDGKRTSEFRPPSSSSPQASDAEVASTNAAGSAADAAIAGHLLSRFETDKSLLDQVRAMVRDSTIDPAALIERLHSRFGSLTAVESFVDEQQSLLVRAMLGREDQANASADARARAALLEQAGLREVWVPDDGHCLFGALAHALGGQTRDTFSIEPFAAAQGVRAALLNRLLTVSDEELAAIAAAPGDRDPSARVKSWTEEAINQLARGLNVKVLAGLDGDRAWGDGRSLAIAAIGARRPIIALEYDGRVTVYHESGSSHTFRVPTDPDGAPTDPSRRLDLAIQLESERGQQPIVIMQQSSTHWLSTEPQ